MADELNAETHHPEVGQLWGIYLIPREKAPDEGYLLVRGQTRGGYYRAHSLFPDGTPEPNALVGRHRNIDDLIDQITEDHIEGAR